MVYSHHKPANRVKTWKDILKYLIDVMFNQNDSENNTVANGCFTALMRILSETFPEYLDPNQPENFYKMKE